MFFAAAVIGVIGCVLPLWTLDRARGDSAFALAFLAACSAPALCGIVVGLARPGRIGLAVLMALVAELSRFLATVLVMSGSMYVFWMYLFWVVPVLLPASILCAVIFAGLFTPFGEPREENPLPHAAARVRTRPR